MVSANLRHLLDLQREEERERERIRKMFARAGRPIGKSSKQASSGTGKGGAGFRLPPFYRTRRAPGSASQYHFHAKKSKASGAGKSPVSCRNKVEYDLGLDPKDPNKDRVKMVFVSSPEGTPIAARDPLQMAEACFQRARQSKYANSNTGQMLHLDTSLPNVLTDDELARLSDQINEQIGQKFGVPCYSGVHLDRGNFHIHSSIPLYEIHADENGGFRLGDRIDHAKRPSERESLGLPRSPAGELRELRKEVADLIADAVADHYKSHPDPEAARHLSERWRHGHLTLPQQVEKAAQRGDVAFVLDNLNREATRKEGPPTGAWRASPAHNHRREAAVEHNKVAGKASEIPGPELITKTLVARVVHLAEQAKLDQPEHFRMLAKQAGLNVHWSPGKDGNVQGVSYSIKGGPRVAGTRAGASLGVLQKKLGWAEKPVFKRFPPREGEEVMDFKNKIIEAKLEHLENEDYVAKSIKVTLFRLKKLEDEALENAKRDPAAERPVNPAAAPTAAAPAALSASPAKPPPAQQAPEAKPAKARPKRKSNDPSHNRKASTQAASRPHPPSAQPVAAKPTPPKALTAAQRDLLAAEWDSREAAKAGTFDGPLAQAQEKLERLEERLYKHRKAEPWPQFEYKRRLFGGTRKVETKEHQEWSERLLDQNKNLDAIKGKIAAMIDQAAADPSLLDRLPDLESQAAKDHCTQEAQRQAYAHTRYHQAIKDLSKARPGSHEASRAYCAINNAIKADPALTELERQRRAEQARQRTPGRATAVARVRVERERPR